MPKPYARIERAALADSLLAAGPDAPTLCAGWTTRDLAAHIVLRERRPDAALGILVKGAAGHTATVQSKLAAGDYPALVEKVRRPQALSLVRIGAVEEAMNLVEFFVHHEDVRRGAAGWQPRELDPGYVDRLAGRLRGMAKLSTRRFPATIAVHPTGRDAFEVGQGGPRIEVSGEVPELLLFFLGRQSAATVTIGAEGALADRLRTARLGI